MKFDSALCFEAFRFATRLERAATDDVWFKPNSVSWDWRPNAWSFDTIGRTPRGGLPALQIPDGAPWGVIPLMPPESDAGWDRLVGELAEKQLPGVFTDLVTDERVRDLGKCGLRLLAIGRRAELSKEGFEALSALGSLTHLVLDIPADDAALEAVARLPDLKALVLLQGAPTDPGLARLRKLSRLELLVLPEGPFTGRGLGGLAEVPLRTLQLSQVPEGVGAAFEALGAAGTLRDFELSIYGLPESAVAPLSRIPSLEHVELTAQGWSNPKTPAALAHLKRLTSLGLSWAYPESLDWVGELQALKRLSLMQVAVRQGLKPLSRIRPLQEISLPDASLEDGHLEALAGLDRLRALDLKSARLSGTGLAHLKGLPRLTHLNLFNCVNITEAGIDALVQLPALEELNLGSCVFPYEDQQTMGLTDRGAANLAGLRTLRRLGLTGNRIVPETVAQLRRSLPGCLIEATYMVRSEIVAACNEAEDHLGSGDAEEAIAAYRRAVERDPRYAPALRGLARALDQRGDLRGAIEAATSAVEADPDADAYVGRGWLRGKAGESAAASEDFARAFEVDPRRVDALLLKAEARIDAKDFAGAIEGFTRWIERVTGPTPDSGAWVQWAVQAFVNRSYAKLEIGGFAGAEADATTALGLDSMGIDARMNRAEAREKQNRHADAERDYGEAAMLKPGRADAYKGRARCRLVLGRRGAAREDLEACLRLQPDDAEAARLLADLGS